MPLLAGKVALITGAGSGIGQGIADRFAREGAKLVIDYVGESDGADDTLALVKQAGGEAITVEGDVTRMADIEKLVNAAYQAFGGLDILVNNAGMEKKAPFTEVTEADFDRVLDVNLRGAFFLTQAFVQRLEKLGKPGRIVNISSVHEDMAFPGFTSYCISKGGMRMMMRNLAVELAPLNITINNIAPGAIATPINAKMMQNQEQMAGLLKNIPLGRMGNVGEVASLAAFLASEEASYVTGSTYVVDGGLMRNYQEQ